MTKTCRLCVTYIVCGKTPHGQLREVLNPEGNLQGTEKSLSERGSFYTAITFKISTFNDVVNI